MIKKILTRTLLFLSIALLVGCLNNKPKPKLKKIEPIPTWFQDVGKSNDGYLYGIGSHPSLQSAKEKALKEIAAKIQVSIQSQTETVSTQFGNSVSQTYQETIQSKVADIQFQDPEIVNQGVANHVHYVKLRVSIDSLTQLSIQELEQANRKLEGMDKIISSSDSKLKKLLRYKQIESELDLAISLNLRLQSLDNLSRNKVNYPYQSELDSLTKEKNQFFSLISSISIFVDVPKDIQSVGSEISKALNQIKINARLDSNSTADGTLSIISTIVEDKIYNDYLVNADISLTLKDKNGLLISSNNLLLKSFSKKDYQDARNFLGFQIKKEIDKKGILPLINL